VALTEMTFVWPTSAAVILGTLPSCRATVDFTGALVTSWQLGEHLGRCDGLGVGARGGLGAWPTGRRSWADAEYDFGSINE